MTAYLFDMPAARSTDPETSHAAAASITDLRERQQAVLQTLKEYRSLTDEELVLFYDQTEYPPQSPSGLRTRRSELVRKGLVEFTGDKRPLESGRLGRVWKAVE